MVETGMAPPGPERPNELDERTVVHLVRALAPLTAPDPRARERMRARIQAGLTATATAERGTTPAITERHPATGRGSRAPRNRPTGTDRGSTRPGELPRAGTGARGRFAIAAVALLALVLSLAGMSLLLARDALPGDALYGVKRTAEAASLGLTFGDEPKALKHLEFAAARVTEIETLAQRFANPADAPTGGYLTALSDFDNDSSAGSRQLIALATRGDGRELDTLRDWAKQQASRLAGVSPRLPGSARNRESASLALLSKIVTRSDDLLARMPCYQITTGSFDDVGALPATGVCERVPGAAPPATNPNTGGGRTPRSGQPLPTTASTPGQTATPPGQTVTPTTAPTAQPGTVSPKNPATTSGGLLPTVPSTVVVPLPLPTIGLPPVLPGLPAVRIGG
jgi:hypothetical protein